MNTGLKLSDHVNIDSTGGSDRLSVGPAHATEGRNQLAQRVGLHWTLLTGVAPSETPWDFATQDKVR